MKRSALAGCLLGTAVGDAIGLPFENLSRASVRTLARDPLRHALVFGRGLVSDDTGHAWMALASLRAADGDVARFRRGLAARLRWWLAAGPPGVGGATARAIVKLWIGVPSTSSGVRSAGNGPAMRAAVLGVALAGDVRRLGEFVRASTRLTHADDRALHAALAVAVAAACAARGELAPAEWRAAFASAAVGAATDPRPFAREFDAMASALDAGLAVDAFADTLGCARGVSGYALHAVPVALYAAARHRDDLRAAVTAVVRCGGDTDSTASVAGAILGAWRGIDAVPTDWRAGLLPWPPFVGRLARDPDAAEALAGGRRAAVEALGFVTWPARLAGNLAVFVLLVGVLVRRTAAVALARTRR